ncbi:MAG: hypothetical protein P4M13_01580 [Alphaproteobacteria bacterium]|nr:hypothetical protein [Alphaproteobacteria bacterium]
MTTHTKHWGKRPHRIPHHKKMHHGRTHRWMLRSAAAPWVNPLLRNLSIREKRQVARLLGDKSGLESDKELSGKLTKELGSYSHYGQRELIKLARADAAIDNEHGLNADGSKMKEPASAPVPTRTSSQHGYQKLKTESADTNDRDNSQQSPGLRALNAEFAQHLVKNAADHSLHLCKLAVVAAAKQAGIPMNSYGDTGAGLKALGYTLVATGRGEIKANKAYPDYTPQQGDIAAIHSPNGHVEACVNGENNIWRSDFRQQRSNPYHDSYPYAVWRPTEKTLAITKSAGPQRNQLVREAHAMLQRMDAKEREGIRTIYAKHHTRRIQTASIQ